MSKGFDPFKPLSINTSAASESSSSSSTSKKQSVLYESLQQHPLHQMQAKYQQSNSSTISSSHSHSTVDGQVMSSNTSSSSNRMELHKATLANATIESTPSSKCNNSASSQVAQHNL